MTRTAFHRDLQALEQSLLTLGSMAATGVETSMSALSLRSAELADAVITQDSELDERAHVIEEHGLLLIATQQPLAADLRGILAVMMISTEMERIGDYAEGIAKLALRNLEEPPLAQGWPVPETYYMSEQVVAMLRASMKAFVERDLAAARRIWNSDDEIDQLQGSIQLQARLLMHDDPDKVERATRLIFVVHNLERIADRVTNICERITTMVTGERARLNATS